MNSRQVWAVAMAFHPSDDSPRPHQRRRAFRTESDWKAPRSIRLPPTCPTLQECTACVRCSLSLPCELLQSFLLALIFHRAAGVSNPAVSTDVILTNISDISSLSWCFDMITLSSMVPTTFSVLENIILHCWKCHRHHQ